jgi:[ribosomal protein S5]-alanine N-acetyltransferase
MHLESNRLLLKPLSDVDCDFILELVNTNSWIKNIGDRNIHSQLDSKAYIEKINTNPNTEYWVVKLKNSQESIGIITIIQRLYLDFKDLGFAFLPKFVKHGYAFEASKVILENIKNNSEYLKIQAVTKPNNAESINLLKKLNFVFEEELLIQQETLQIYTFDLGS